MDAGMSAPPKPWESTAASWTPTMSKQNPLQPPLPPQKYNDDMNSYGDSYGGAFGAYQGGPLMSRYGGMGYPGVYGSPYSGYGTYGGMFGGFGSAGGDSQIARLADESTRSAFQSVEHLVHAFSSVSMMLESTYFALYSSFRAVIGVADHLSKVTEQLSQLMNSLSLVRTIRWIIRRTLHVLGIRRIDPAETVWVSASKPSQVELAEVSTRSSWPVLAFFSVVMGTPYLIYRMFGLSSRESAKWASGESPHYLAVALYDFIGGNDKELSFQAGAKLRLAPKNLQSKIRGWLVASVDGERTGLVPYNYLKILGPSESASTPVQSCPQPTPQTQTSGSDASVHPIEEEQRESLTNTHNDFVNLSMSEIAK